MTDRERAQRYYDALKRITLYDSPDRLRLKGEKDWGVEYPDCMAMSYENIQQDAARAIRGHRRPK